MTQKTILPSWACVWVPALKKTSEVLARQHLLDALRELSPRVAEDENHSGLFWLDIRGMTPWLMSHVRLRTDFLQSSNETDILRAWTLALASVPGLSHQHAVGVLGERRWCLWALARQQIENSSSLSVQWRGRVLQLSQCSDHGPKYDFEATTSVQTELQQALKIPLAILPLKPTSVAQAHHLRIRTLGDLKSLSHAGAAARLPAELVAWCTAMRDPESPLHIEPKETPVEVHTYFDTPTVSTSQLLFSAKSLVPALLAKIATKYKKLSALDVALVLETPGHLVKTAKPQVLRRRLVLARPGASESVLLRLLQLYFSGLVLSRAVSQLTLAAVSETATHSQLLLWPVKQSRHQEQIDDGVAQVRAALGDHAVVIATLIPAHLPESAFAWMPVSTKKEPKKKTTFASHGPLPLVRRVFSQPRPWQPVLSKNKKWRFLSGANQSDDELCKRSSIYQGPLTLSGQWWDAPYDRDYYYVRDLSGAWLWVAFDRQLRRWQWHGVVD